jgi:signal transduction histidine kinase
MDIQLTEIIKGVSNTYGENFFNAITLQLDKVIKSDYTFIARLNKSKHTSKTVALVGRGKLVDNFEYALKDTPCNDVADDSVCIYPNKVINTFPKDQLLIDMNIEGYLGTPLYDSNGEVMGLMVALYENEIIDQELTLALFQLFSGRISGEFERVDRENELVALNLLLDHKVKERTQALEDTLSKLTQAQEKLIENEKMAGLGDLVAGVAHEVNTPLGVAITSNSIAFDAFKLLEEKLEKDELSVKDMNDFIEQQRQAFPMLSDNLQRAKVLIDNFKKMATDQVNIQPTAIDINIYYQRLISTLNPILKRKKTQLSFQYCEQGQLTTFPGCHAQLLTNLVSNSIEHGFKKTRNHNEENQITISISNQKDEQGIPTFIVDYFDNGKGIESSLAEKIFTPFYTTARDKGHTGLGLSVCYNIVVQNFKGVLKCLPCLKGVHFQYRFNDLNDQSSRHD